MSSERQLNEQDKFEYNWDDQEVWKNISLALDKKKRRRRFFIFFYLSIFTILLSSIFFVSKLDKERAIIHPLNYAQSEEQFSQMSGEGESISLRKENVPQNIFGKNIVFNNLKNLEQMGFESEIGEKFTNRRNIDFLLQEQVQKSNLEEGIGINHLKVVKESDSFNLEQLEFNKLDSEIINALNVESLENSESLLPLVDTLNSDTFGKQIDHSVTNNHGFKKALCIQFINACGVGWRNDQFDPAINWQALRHGQEKYLYSTAHGVAVSRIFKSNFFMTSGIEIQRFISNLKGSNVSTSRVNIYSDSARVQNINGIDYYYGGTIEKTIHSTENFNVFNKYTYFLIPIKFGYFVSKNSTGISIDLGTSFLMGGQLSGYTIDTDNKIKPFSSINSPVEINKFKWTNLFSSVNFSRRLSTDLDLSLGIQFQLGIQPMAMQRVNLEKLFSFSYYNIFFSSGLIYRIK
ncbi:MAG: hypothetical protein IPM48_03525 [Saprospiraceae bacterium]|nr:hypothetical protein [Saprospiraceae bacterium]